MDKTDILRRYTRIGLSLPVLLPLALMAIAQFERALYGQWLEQLPGWLLLVFAILIGSLFIGGIPYLIYYLCTWHFCQRHNYREIYLYLLISPLAFYLLQFAGLLSYEVAVSILQNRTYGFSNNVGKYASLSAFVFPIAYSYIVLILVAYHIRIRTICPTQRSVGGYHG